MSKTEKHVDKHDLYKLTFPNGMVYIGIAYDAKERWANDGLHYQGQKVYEYIEKFGWKNIKREILVHIPFSDSGKGWLWNNDTLRRLERELIHAYGDRCYNLQASKSFHVDVARRAREKGNYAPQIWWEIDGVCKPAKEWCSDYGKSYGVAKNRMERYGLTPKQALTFPTVPSKGGYNRDPVRYWRECGCFDKETEARA